MPLFSNANISIATAKDISAVKDLLNSAYRGEKSKKGWTTEAHLIAGDVRTDEGSVQKVIDQPGSVILIYTNKDEQITACVNLQQHAEKIYLGMFSVSPDLQGGGIGKQMLLAAEEYAANLNCTAIYMTVISVRAELISWYQRHGYRDTGERKPFAEDAVTGKHLQPLDFMTLEKPIVNLYNRV